jgi:glycosyltransferase involved in cell wall biosynthesis
VKTPKITIAIPCHNNSLVIRESIESALAQDCKKREILVVDDASTDGTVNVVKDMMKEYPHKIRLVVNNSNLGIGGNLVKCMEEAKGKYIVYLCGDDLFANSAVASDVVSTFDNTDVSVLGRYFYFFMDGKPGAIGTCRERNIFINACCPSGMAFRKNDLDITPTDRIFIEMPHIVYQYLDKGNTWSIMPYDTIAARFHPGGNTGTKSSYYTESPTINWLMLVGKDFKDYPMFVQLKLRAPERKWQEIKIVYKNNNMVVFSPSFWFYVTLSMLPAFILRPIALFYRNVITRMSARIIQRGDE